MQEAELNKIQLTILRLLETFITRHYLVFTAMQEIAPDKLYDIPREMIESEVDGVLRQIPKPRPDYWGSNDEWKVFVHGIGCKLTHVASGEPIEWDSPDLDVFDSYWFSNWLTWYLKNSEPIDMTTALLTQHLAETDGDVKTLVFETVNQLLKAGVLLDVNARSLNKYKLTRPMACEQGFTGHEKNLRNCTHYLAAAQKSDKNDDNIATSVTVMF